MRVIKNDGPSISATLVKMVNLVDAQLPEEWDMEDVFDLAKDAWNLTNSNDDLAPLLNTHPYKRQLQQMIALKKEEQSTNGNMILEVYFGEDERVYVKSQNREDYDKAVVFEALQLLSDMPEPPANYEMVDRNAVSVAPKRPFFAWLNKLYPNDPVKEHQVKEHNIYLIHETGSEEGFEEWLKENFTELFEQELYHWHTNEADWPQKRDYGLFKKWFRVQLHSMVFDFEEDELTKE